MSAALMRETMALSAGRMVMTAAASLGIHIWSLGTSSCYPEVKAIGYETAFCERITITLCHAATHARGSDPEMLITMSIQHLVGGHVHNNKAALVDKQHEHPRCCQTVCDGDKNKQRIAREHTVDPVAER